MKTFIWTPQRLDLEIEPKHIHAIMQRCLAAGIPMRSAAKRPQGILFNFSDEISEEDMARAIQIGETYDPVGEAQTAQLVEQQRAADLRPFKQIQTLIDESVRDANSLQGASLAELRGILANLIDRQTKMLRGMGRLIEYLQSGEDE